MSNICDSKTKLAAGHTSSRVSAPPGGKTSDIFGNSTPAKQQPTASPAKTVNGGTQAESTQTPQAAPMDAATETAPAEDTELSLGDLKLTVVGTVSKLKKDSPEVRAVLAELLKKLEGTGAVEKTVIVDADAALEALRAALKGRGTHGIVSIGKKFKSMDDDNDKKISFDEWHKAVTEMELDKVLQPSDVHRLFRYFDADCNGYLTFEELLLGLKGVLNERRKKMVDMAFKVFDKSGDGQISLDDLRGRYDASRHPDVVSGARSPDAVLEEFLSTFEAHGGGVKGDGIITKDEFTRYYCAVSASIDDDDYFELVIRNVWHISGGEGWCQNTTCRRVLVVHTDGSQSVREIKDDFDISATDTEAMKKNLVEQGVKDIKSVALYGMPDEHAPAGVPSGPPSAANKPSAGMPSGPPSATKPSGPPPSSPSATPLSANRTYNRAQQQRSSITFG